MPKNCRQTLICFLAMSTAAPLAVSRPSEAATAEAALPPAVSGHEERLGRAIETELRPLGPKHDNLGNVYVTVGSGAPHKLVAVAMDEPGYVVSGITDDGYLRVQRLPQAAVTPVFDVLHFAQPVFVTTRSGKEVNGVFAGLSVHLQPGRVGGPKMNHPDELYVDVGARSRADARAAGVDVLDPVTVRPQWQQVGQDQLSGESSGDRSALEVVLDLAKHIEKTRTKGSLTIAFVTQHWTGGRGMNRLLTELHPDEMVFVGHLRSADLAGGVLIGTAENSGQESKDFAGEWKALAESGKIAVHDVSADPPRIAGYVGGAEYPKRFASLGMAVRWAETPAETVSRKDVEDLRQLLGAYAGAGPASSPGAKRAARAVPAGLIESLVTSYGASGHESDVREKIKELLPEWARKRVRTDDAGNLILHLGDGKAPAKARKLAFVAHMDELGYQVAKIEDDGRLVLEVLGGGYTQFFLGHTELVHKADGTATGAVIEMPSGWEKPGFEWPQGPRTMDEPVHAYVGTKSREETEKLGIKPGDWVTIEKEYRPLLGARANARSFDDRVGCAALLVAAGALGPDLPGRDVTLIWSTEEEVGLKGAAAAAAHMAEDGKVPAFVFAIDTFVSSDSPLESKRFADAEIGKGFVVRAVDNSNVVPLDYVDRVLALAREHGIPAQYGATGGGNDGAVFTRYGSVDVALGWPLRYSHSPGEVIDKRDLDALGRIVAVVAKSW
jgi:putative aminopeptidase FrvX